MTQTMNLVQNPATTRRAELEAKIALRVLDLIAYASGTSRERLTATSDLQLRADVIAHDAVASTLAMQASRESKAAMALSLVARLDPALARHISEIQACAVCMNPLHDWRDTPHAEHVNNPVVTRERLAEAQERLESTRESYAAVSREHDRLQAAIRTFWAKHEATLPDAAADAFEETILAQLVHEGGDE